MTNSNNDAIPIIGVHRGVGLHDNQDEPRLVVVREAIDRVYEIDEIDRLIDIAADPSWPPESRLFAGAKLEALHQIATDRREVRPAIDLQYVHALLAGVNSLYWRDTNQYCSMLDYSKYGAPGSRQPAKRQIPLKKRGEAAQ